MSNLKRLCWLQSTHEAVVLTTDNVGAALATANPNNADGRAGEADQDVHALNYDAEQAKKSCGAGVTGLFIACTVSHFTTVAAYERTYGLDAVAALDVARRAGAFGNTSGSSGDGDSRGLGGGDRRRRHRRRRAPALHVLRVGGGDSKDRYEGEGSNGGKAGEHLEDTEESLGYFGLSWCIWKTMPSPLVLRRFI